MQKKKQADEHLVELEARIYSLETDYFKETSNFGSLMFGLEGYLGLAPASGGQSGGIRRSTYREVKDAQRIFSNTSSSSRRAVSLYNKYMSSNGTSGGRQDDDYDSDGADDLGEDDDVVASTRGSAQKRSRPSLTPTPKSSSSSQPSRKRK